MKIITKAKFHNNYISVCSHVEYTGKREKTAQELENLEKGKKGEYNGYMSKTTAKHCKEILTCFMESTKQKEIEHKKQKLSGKKPMITFITLTLSSKQMHDDNFIKRNMLGSFLISLKNHCDVKSYFWRAEPQKNGNIHFHIIVDRYIRHEFIRSEWNKIQERYGYIQEFEKKHKHKNPNSTDIHALKSINNSVGYVCKYCCKKGDENNERKIQGRIWGCSDNIRNLKVYECVLQEVDNRLLIDENLEMIETIKKIEKNEKSIKIIYTDFGKVLCSRLSIMSIIKKTNEKISKEMENYYLNLTY